MELRADACVRAVYFIFFLFVSSVVFFFSSLFFHCFLIPHLSSFSYLLLFNFICPSFIPRIIHQVEAAVLHMAWLLHRLGTTDGAVAYLEYLLDVPPPGVEAWVLHLLCGSVHLAVENKLAGLACLEAGQQIYAQKVCNCGEVQ